MLAEELGPPERAPRGAAKSADGRRVSSKPLIEIARTKTKDQALAEALREGLLRFEPTADIYLSSISLRAGFWLPKPCWKNFSRFSRTLTYSGKCQLMGVG